MSISQSSLTKFRIGVRAEFELLIFADTPQQAAYMAQEKLVGHHNIPFDAAEVNWVEEVSPKKAEEGSERISPGIQVTSRTII